jgi:hypothetical protein
MKSIKMLWQIIPLIYKKINISIKFLIFNSLKKLIMKKTFVIAGCVLLLTACGQISVKGAWSKEDKDRANAEIKKVDADLDILGDKKLENNYDDFKSADSDEKGCEKLAVECATELMQ